MMKLGWRSLLFIMVWFELVQAMDITSAADEPENIKIDEILTASLAMSSFEEQPQLVYTPEWFQAAEQLSPFVKSYNEIAEAHKMQGLNVHEFNRLFAWKFKLGELIKIDELIFHTNPDRSLEAIIGLLRDTSEYKALDQVNRQVLEANLARLIAHVKGSPVEKAETDCNVPQIMSRIWSLIEMMDAPQWFNELKLNPSEEIHELMFYMSENSRESGGCYQGFAGRLCRNYLVLLKKMLGFDKDI